MQDHTERMRVIKGRLDGSGGGGVDNGDSVNAEQGHGGAASVAEKEELLDELVEIVENIDYARHVNALLGQPRFGTFSSGIPHRISSRFLVARGHHLEGPALEGSRQRCWER